MSASSSLEDLQHHDVEEEVVEPTLATEEWTGGSSPLPEDTLPPLEESTTLSPSNLPLLSSQTLHVSMTLPHGFQLQRTLMHPKSTVRLVVFTPHHHLSDAFASLDTHAVHFWRGAQRVQRIPIAGVELTKEDLVSIQDGGNGFGGLMGISLWVYVRKHRLFLVATDHLELKVLDQNLVELSRSSSVKPVLSLEYIDSLEEVIVGCIGSIRICSLVREAEHTNRTIFYLKPPRLVLNDFEDDEWANKTLFLPSTVKLYVACDNRIYIYDYESGKRLDTLPNLHELSITCIAFYEPTEWLITAGKEGQIRIWNIQHYLVASINAHSQTITSLLLPLNFSNLDKPPPILLSSSLDGSLRLWDLEKLQCIYKHATQHEVLGLGMLKKDFFFHYSRKSIYIWHLNRLLSTYYYTQSRVVSLKRVCHHQLARILVVTEDGCIRLLSPVSGEVLVTCFPTYKQIHIIDILHDLAEDRIYSLMSNGEILTYATNSNPATVSYVLEPNLSLESSQITCFDAFYSPFIVIAGTATGQILHLDVVSGERKVLVQAHPSDIVAIQCHRTSSLVFSAANDKSIKVWLYTPDTETLDPQYTVTTTHFPTLLKPSTDVPTTFLLASANFALTMHGMDAFIQHANADDHDKQVTCIEYLSSLRLFISSGMDGTLKLWNHKNVLIREIQVGEPVTSVTFLNLKGDLLIGVHDEVSIIYSKDYLPRPFLKELQNLYFEEDLVEDPIPFDSKIDFWKAFYTKVDFHKEQWELAETDILPFGDTDDSDLVHSLYDHSFSYQPVKEIVHRNAIKELENSIQYAKSKTHYSSDNLFQNFKKLGTDKIRRLSLVLARAEQLGFETLETNEETLKEAWPTNLDPHFITSALPEEEVDYHIQKNPLLSPTASTVLLHPNDDPSSEAAKEESLAAYRQQHRILAMDKIANIIRAKLQENKSMLTSGVMLPNSTNIASVIENELSMVPVPMRKITKSKFPSSTTKKKPMGVSDALHKTTPSPFGKKEKPKSPDALVSIDEEVTEKINISSSLLFDDDVEGEEGEEEGISFAEKMKKIQMEKTKDLSTLTPTTSHVDLSSPSSQTTYLTVPSMENTLDPKIKKASKLKVSSAAVVGSVMMGGRKEIQPLSSKKRHELETKSSPSTMLPPIASSPTDSLSTMDEKIGATPIPVTTMTPRLPEKLITKVPTLPKPPTKRMGQLSPGLLPTLPSSLKNVLRSKPSTSTKPKVHPAVVLLTTSPSSELQPVPQTSLSPRPKSPGPTSSLTLPSPTGRKSSTPTLLLKRKSIHGEISSMSPWSSTLKSEGLNEKRMLGLLNSKHGHARLHPAYVDLSEFASMEKYFSNASPSLRFQGRLEAPPTPSTSSMSSSSSPTTPPYPSPSSSSFFSPTELPSLPPRILKLLQEKTMTFPFHQLTQLPWYPSLQPLSPSFTLTQVLTTLGKVLEDPDLPDETKWECVGLLVTLYTSYPMDIADPYTLCVMPLMQVMQHEKKLTQLRAYLVRQAPTWLPQGGKPLLQALITRLGDLDDEVRQVTVQVFLAFQIKSKDQLVWLMKQCDFMMDPKEVWRNPKEKMVTTPRSPSTPPSHPMSMTSIPTTRTTSTSQKWVSHLDGLFDQYQREQSHQRNVSVKKVQAWKIS